MNQNPYHLPTCTEPLCGGQCLINEKPFHEAYADWLLAEADAAAEAESK